MKNIAFLILITVALMSCDKIIDSPQNSNDPEQQNIEVSILPETSGKDDSDDGAKRNSEAIDSGSVPVLPQAEEGMEVNN